MPYPATDPVRGEIYWVDFSPARGSEQAGRRPAVVISVDSFNRRMPVVSIAAITSQVKNNLSRVAVFMAAGQPLEREGQILAFQTMTIDKGRIGGYLGVLSEGQVAQLNAAMRLAWGL